MPMPVHPQMRGPQRTKKDWFRIENATVDDNKSDDNKTVIYIYDVIGYSWWDEGTDASGFIKQLSAVKTPQIELHLNSPGGDIFDGVAIYNALKSHDAQVTVIVDALAASAASFIAQAGDEIVMTKGSMMMIHDGSAGVYGYASDLRKTADLLDKLSNNIADMYADRAGQTAKFWRDLMIEETWYTASEAVEVGLADREDGEAKEEDKALTNQWMPLFNYAGRGAAPDPLIARQRIANRLKENTVPQAQDDNKNDDTQQTGDPNPASPEVDEDAKTTDGSDVSDAPDSPGEVPDPPTGDQGTVDNKDTVSFGGPRANFTNVSVDGQDHMVPKAVAQRLSVLETFRNETLTQGRKDFVQTLATENKILASNIDKLTTYALSLDDAGFAAWKATWDDAPVVPMLRDKHHGGTGSTGDGPQSREAGERADEVETLEATVRHLQYTLSNDQIKNTPSFKKLVELNPDFKL